MLWRGGVLFVFTVAPIMPPENALVHSGTQQRVSKVYPRLLLQLWKTLRQFWKDYSIQQHMLCLHASFFLFSLQHSPLASPKQPLCESALQTLFLLYFIHMCMHLCGYIWSPGWCLKYLILEPSSVEGLFSTHLSHGILRAPLSWLHDGKHC